MPRCPRCGLSCSGPLAEHQCLAAGAPEATLVDGDEEPQAATLDGPLTLDPETGDPPQPEGPSATLLLPEGDEAEGFSGPVGLGYLEVLATQRGAKVKAKVLLDGLPQGDCPVTLPVLPGEHLVRLERAGASAELCLLVVSAGEPVHVELALKPSRR